MEPICSKNGCVRPVSARGLCATHYRKAMRTGELTSQREERPLKKKPGAGGSFRCPNCLNERSEVLDSRPTVEGLVRRRRYCQSCTKRFSTVEVPLEWMESLEFVPLLDAASAAFNNAVEKFNHLRRALKDNVKRAQV